MTDHLMEAAWVFIIALVGAFVLNIAYGKWGGVQ